jgi:Fic family protein
MDYALFESSPTGKLIPTIHDQLAYVPNELAPEIDLAAIFNAYGAASRGIAALNAKITQLGNPNIILRPLQRREALTSSAMEGTYTTSDELALLEAGEERNARAETREVNNYRDALTHAVQSMDKLPISHRLICQTHEKLLGGLPGGQGGNKRPGEYKQFQNWIGGVTIETARFVPPPPEETQICMDRLEAFINREAPEKIDPLLEAALIHYQFETIHPFADGNGRVGRILIPIILLDRRLIQSPVFYPSASIEGHKDEYIDLMYNVSAKGEWTEWLAFFLRICADTCAKSVEIVDRLVQLNAEFKRKAMEKHRSNNVIQLIDEMFKSPVTSTPLVQKLLNVTPPAARQTIRNLEEIGLLEKMTFSAKPEYFIARSITEIAG